MKKNTKPTLVKANPKLARAWHPTKNAPLTPKDVTTGSHKKVWWRCLQVHEWQATIANRSSGQGCPYCSGKRVNTDNSLQTIAPLLARQWHPTKNARLTPKDVTPGSHKQVWWVCRIGHAWRAPVERRNSGSGCPYCAGRYSSHENCLQTVNPKLAREWHPTKNAPLTPRDVTAGTHKKVWWICKKGHEWNYSVEKRFHGEGCPYCSGRRVCKDNSLKTLNPGLARQWHPTRNAPLTPEEVGPGSHKKAWWLCRKGHEWEAQIKSRNAGHGCAYCSHSPRRKATRDDCLETVAPRIAREWHPTKNVPLTPKDVTSRSGKKVWWLCKKGHEWEVKIAERAEGGCPYCSGHRACKDNCLQNLNLGLAGQWHPTKNMLLTPKDVTARSNKKVWWLCKKGHEWAARIKERAGGTGCPFCSGHRPTKENCLEITAPWIAREWHPIKNALWSPKDVAPYSQRQIWWKCKKGHESRESVCSRSQRGGCPVCVLKRKAPRLFERGACRS